MNHDTNNLIKLHIIKYFGDLECFNFNNFKINNFNNVDRAAIQNNKTNYSVNRAAIQGSSCATNIQNSCNIHKNIKFNNFKIIKTLVKDIENLTYLDYININSERHKFYGIYTKYTKLNVYIHSSNQELNLDNNLYRNLILNNINANMLGTIRCDKLSTNSNLDNITKIGNNFLSTTNLKELDLTLFTKVVEIGNRFMSHNRLTSINLFTLVNVTTIGDDFLANNELILINLLPLTNLITIGSHFLSYNALTSIDLSPLCNVMKVDIWFLIENNFKSIDVSQLKNISASNRYSAEFNIKERNKFRNIKIINKI